MKTMGLLAALLAASAPQLQAATLTADGLWNEFDVDESVAVSGDLEWIDLDGEALSFSFDLGTASILKVVDGGFAGDRFEIFDNGVSLGLTAPAADSYPASQGLDFDAAYADDGWSHGLFNLTAGSHNITGVLYRSARDDGGNTLNATVGAVSLTAVPLPPALGLFAAGGALLGAIPRRRKA